MELKVIPLSQLPKEMYSLCNLNYKVSLNTPNDSIRVNSVRTKSNVADLDGSLYYFGNTYGNINPYKNVTNMNELVVFLNRLSKHVDGMIKNRITDVTYLNVTSIMNDATIAEKLLTSNDIVYPDYTVELLDKEYLEIEIDHESSVITTKNNLVINKVGVFDLAKLFKMEYLNSLYVVKLAHRRDLDLRGIMNLIQQVQVKKMIDVVHIADSHENLTIYLHVPENLLGRLFGYKLKKRITKVRIDDITSILTSQLIKRPNVVEN